MSCNYCYHAASDHTGDGTCGQGFCNRCQTEREAKAEERIAYLTGWSDHTANVYKADEAADKALNSVLHDRRVLVDEVRRLRARVAELEARP